MPGAKQSLSDKALSVLAFAAYHQLESGQKVTSVIRRDGSGHSADPDAVAELEQGGLATATDSEITFTAEGEKHLSSVIAALRGGAGA